MRFDIVTIFPRIFDSYFSESILKRAQRKKLVRIKIHDLREQTFDKHKTVDDRPYGGGPGMILKIEPIYKTLQKIKHRQASKVILLDPAGKTFDQRLAQKFSKLNQLILICGRYEGFDHRVTKLVDERVSIGDYVLSGGELAAMVIIEAVARLIPAVLGHEHALDEETFSLEKGYLEYPQYTRPEVFKLAGQERAVPKVLLSGDHQKIKQWRQKHFRRRK